MNVTIITSRARGDDSGMNKSDSVHNQLLLTFDNEFEERNVIDVAAEFIGNKQFEDERNRFTGHYESESTKIIILINGESVERFSPFKALLDAINKAATVVGQTRFMNYKNNTIRQNMA